MNDADQIEAMMAAEHAWAEQQRAEAMDESDLSDATQARPEDVAPGAFDLVEAYQGKEARRAAEQQAAAYLAQARPEDVAFAGGGTIDWGACSGEHLCGCTADGPSLACQAEGLWHGARDSAAPAAYVADMEHERRMDIPAEREAEMEAAWGATGFVPPPEDVAAQWSPVCADCGSGAHRACATEEPHDGPGWDKATRSIVSIAGLNWAGGVLREIRAAMAQNEEMAKGEIEALEHRLAVARLRLDRAQKPLKADAEFFERAISTYAQTHKAEILKGYGKAQSRRFPSGLKVAWRKEGGEYRWRQDMTPKEREEALLRWATREEREFSLDLPLTKQEPVPDVPRIKEYLEALVTQDKEQRQTPPGLEWVEPGESIIVKVGEEK